MVKSDIFPFANISNRELFLEFNSTQMQACSKNNFQQFKYKDYKFGNRNTDLDPDNNFYNAVNTSCEYYTEGQVSNKLNNCNSLAVMHFNARSLQANFDKIELCVTQINDTVDIVAISEIWLTDSDSGNLYELNGYTVHIPGKYKKGGGASLYIGNHLYFDKLNALSQVIENVMETVLN